MASHSVWFVALGRTRLVWLSQALATGLEVRGRSQFGGMVETRQNSGLGEELYYQTKSKGKRTVPGLSRMAGAGMGRQSHPQRWLAGCLQNHEDSLSSSWLWS